MRWWRNLMYAAEEISPVGWVIVGAATLVTLPVVRKGVRSAAVMAASGVLAAGSGLATALSSAGEELEDIVAEAKQRNRAPSGSMAMAAAGAHGVADAHTPAWMPSMASRKGKTSRSSAVESDNTPEDMRATEPDNPSADKTKF